MHHPIANFLTLLLLSMTLAACGGDTAEAPSAQDNADFEARKTAMLAEMQAHFDNKVSMPPAVQEAFERGEFTQAEIDKRSAAGEFPKFFLHFKNKPFICSVDIVCSGICTRCLFKLICERYEWRHGFGPSTLSITIVRCS